MSLPGIDVRPLVTLSGDADFAEVFFNDVRVPADALLGPVNGGWQIATTTLSHERAGAARLYTEMQVRLADLVTDLADVQIDDRPALEDPTTLRRLGEIALRIKYLEVLCQRSISAILHGGDAFGSASLAKTIWGEVGQEHRRVGLRPARDAPRRPPLGRLPLDVALAHHRRRDDADQQEHHRPARSGVAALMNLELTDEQIALRDTVRSFLAEKASHRRACPPDARRSDRHDRGGLARARRPGHHRTARAAGIRRRRHDDGRGRHRRSRNSAPDCTPGRGCPVPSPRPAH